MAKDKWIAGAIKHPGALTKKAKAAGQTVAQFCSSTSGKDTTTKRQCNLASTLRGMSKKR
jgi:hypothetical protein